MATIEHEVTFAGVTPHDLYEALLDEGKFASWSGKPASISREVGGEMSAYDGHVLAKNRELITDQRIVQDWRTGRWPKGFYHRATFSLEPTEAGTRLTFTQTGVPAGAVGVVAQEWEDFYWAPLKLALERTEGGSSK